MEVLVVVHPCTKTPRLQIMQYLDSKIGVFFAISHYELDRLNDFVELTAIFISA